MNKRMREVRDAGWRRKVLTVCLLSFVFLFSASSNLRISASTHTRAASFIPHPSSLIPHPLPSWRSENSGTMAWLYAVYFVNAMKGWAVGGNGVLLKTEDGGRTWQKMARPSGDALHDLYFSDERTGWIVCERDVYQLRTSDELRTYLMKTEDAGATWKRVNMIGADANARLVRAVFAGMSGWTFGEGGVVYTTRDGGATWGRQRVPTRYLLLGGMFLDSSQGWLVGAGTTIIQTSDGGETWREGEVAGTERVRFNAVSFADRRHGWAVGASGRVFATNDGGRIWNEQISHIAADLLDVKFLDSEEGWAVGNEGAIIHTTDGGMHWTVEQSGTTHQLERIFFTDRDHGWAVGFGGTILSYSTSAQPQPPELR
ncbi:MAG TPA: YCF48-related protein [Pyrinomonadaceae bacterium]|nr:YCF48-related protein [Pyrinomonadaceae bacterium]